MTEKLRKNKNHYNNGGYGRTNEFRKLHKKKVEDYLQLSVNKKESMRLMKIYVKELNEFCSEKLNTSIAGTLILQGY